MLTKYSQISKVWTGGVVGSVAAKKFSLWFESEEKIKFTNFLDGNDETREEDNTVGAGNVFIYKF